MSIFIDLLILLALFVVLGLSADFVVKNIKYLGAILKIHLFVFGVLLGFITSLPELSLGISATIDHAGVLSVGNLIGGIIVMLGLILGTSLILNRKIITDGPLASIIPAVVVIFSPILFGLDGKYSFFDGLIMIGLYVGLVLYLYFLNYPGIHHNVEVVNNLFYKSIFFVILGIIGVLVSSNWIIRITLDLLNQIHVSQLVIGLVIFSIGTNLPEISVAITSWRKKSSEISLGHLLSSSFTNVLILGILSILSPIVFEVNFTFWMLAVFLGIVLILFTYFYHSGKKMDRREGIILLSVYLLFVIANVCFEFFK